MEVVVVNGEHALPVEPLRETSLVTNVKPNGGRE